MFITAIEGMHGKPGRFRVVYWSQGDSTPKRVWKDDLTEQEANQEEIVCYRTLNEL